MLFEKLLVVVLGLRFLEFPKRFVRLTFRHRFLANLAKHLTFNRYSTALSGLEKAACIALSMSALRKPILSMFAIAASLWGPSVIAVGSLNVGTSPAGADGTVGAGEGVGGIFEGAEDVVDCVGAEGADGVCAEAELGVDGAALLAELAGGAFG